MVVKTFENFEHDNSKIWIIGIPSGEALQVDREIHNELYKRKLIFYTTKYSQIGFFAFKDEDLEEVKKLSFPVEVKDYMIFDNEYEEELLKMMRIIIEKFPKYAEFYVSNEFIGISFSNIYIEIEKKDTSPKYLLTKRIDATLVDSYNIATDKLLLKSLEKEMSSS